MEVTLPTDLNLAPDFNVCIFHHRVFSEEAPSFFFGCDKHVFLGRAQIPASVASVDPSPPRWCVCAIERCIALFWKFKNECTTWGELHSAYERFWIYISNSQQFLNIFFLFEYITHAKLWPVSIGHPQDELVRSDRCIVLFWAEIQCASQNGCASRGGIYSASRVVDMLTWICISSKHHESFVFTVPVFVACGIP